MPDDWGIAEGFHDVDGVWHDTPSATREALRNAMGRPEPADGPWGDGIRFAVEGTTAHLPAAARLITEHGDDHGTIDALPAGLPSGYHCLRPVAGGPDVWLVVHPETCPPAPYGWGVATQVHSLWRPDGWGVGDLADVGDLCAAVTALGGRMVLLSPLHAPAPTLPQQPSPYYPSSRQWLNPLLIPMTAARPSTLANTAGEAVDRDAVWAAKRGALQARFEAEGGRPEWRTWAAGQADLDVFCTFNALAELHGPRWQEWPARLRRPADAVGAPETAGAEHTTRVDFHRWCQWLARTEVDRAAAHGGRVLVGDLAVGGSPDGADAWIHQDVMALDVRIGAPPDPFNTAGQDWGLPPFVPWKLRRARYAPFIAILRSAMTSMAGVRVDHVMGLFRQFWIPGGAGPADGAYVQLPASELLALVCLEAQRAGVFVVGEDLGTVQPEVRTALSSAGMLGTKVWLFETDVANWASANLGTVTTHDLPTVTGVWNGDGTPEMRDALERLALHSRNSDSESGGADRPPTVDDVLVAVHDEIGRSAAVLTLATMDDLAGSAVRPNLPGTVTGTPGGVPNWCVRFGATVDQILSSDPGAAIVGALAARCPRWDSNPHALSDNGF